MERANFNRSLTWLWVTGSQLQGTLVDRQSSPRRRSGTGHISLTVCHQRPCTPTCNPKVAPRGWCGWAVSFHTRGGHRSWCPLSPSLRSCWEFCCDAKHRSMCPATTLFAWPRHGVPHQLVAPPRKMDDLLESFQGLSSLGFFGCRFHQMNWTFSPASDSWSVSSCLLKS